jgi:type III pantothenate kinase
MNLLIDMGNTRLKWATAIEFDFMPGTPIANAAINRQTLIELWQTCVRPNQIAISCVSNDRLYDLVISVANDLWSGIRIIRATSEEQGFGVTNAYQEPEKLGIDRWLSMIAGYQLYPKALCIVDCGSAITVDVIDGSGKHLGGLISPGLRLMKEALARNTANLQLNETNFPFGLATNTGSAICNGTFSAACGLIDSVLNTQSDTTQLLLTGGDAAAIAAYISRPAIINPDLVLRGLALLLHKPT